MNITNRRRPVAALLFCSGLCALIYQTVWLREFRLIFGASTPASAAVLGVFMGGLGLGSAFLGRRAEAARRPLLYYGNLELLIALAAASTPGLVWLVQQLYGATGGAMVLSHGLATVVRLALATFVLIIPTFLMGGTLPAAARAVESEDDQSRRSLALLYGCNTMGAVTGAALSTFVLVEALGNRMTLWLACALNIAIAMIARATGRSWAELPATETAPVDDRHAGAGEFRFVIFAAALAGFAFMLMELVWYRMLSPILGGSTFTFGLILIVALLGIGIGGGAYSLRSGNRRVHLRGFALSCAIEALFLAIPYGLGDRLAVLALMLRPLGAIGFAAQVFGWSIVACIVVLPASIVAGYQFPMLIGLLGEGRTGVARHTGLAYAANTVGAIIGSLAGGFGLLPLLTALGVWKAVTVTLAGLAIFAVARGQLRGERLELGSVAAAAAAVALLFCTGPTAVWRHGGIGAGRADSRAGNQNYLREWGNFISRSLIWDAEGVESSVGLIADSGFAFVVNGKIDGNSRFDAGTQVMAGMLGALTHPHPQTALVIGLGTGSTAGWLGKVATMERVDVIELEPAILEIARRCAPVNQAVMNNPKVHHFIGDAREVLFTAPGSYDIIFSEPSNPYRAGIASLFTVEFYQAAARRLAAGGVFVQWLQTYDVDGETVRTVFRTLSQVFPHIQTWQSQSGDLVLVGSKDSIALDATVLRQRILEEPMRSALFNAWRVDSLEGVLAHFVGDEELARRAAESDAPIATDDRNSLEFGFARGVGRRKDAQVADDVIRFAKNQNLGRPALLQGDVDWDKVAALEPSTEGVLNVAAQPVPGESPLRKAHREFLDLYVSSRYPEAERYAENAKLEPLNPVEREALAEIAVLGGKDPGAVLDEIGSQRPTDAIALRGMLLAGELHFTEAADLLIRTFESWQEDPWVSPNLASHALAAAQAVARRCNDPALASRIYDTLRKPFAVELIRERRLLALVEVAKYTAPERLNAHVRESLSAYDSFPLWRKDFLEQRVRTYDALKDSQMERAALELRDFLDHEPVRFDSGLRKSDAAVATR